MRVLLSALLTSLSIVSATGQSGIKVEKGLKDYYEHYFPMGVSVSSRSLVEPEASFILRNFNSLTAENAMKMGPIHPEENRFYWDDADVIVNFAQTHKLKVRGHTLCWHQQTPSWIFTDAKGDTVSKAVLLQRLEKHITAVVSRYKGKIYAWDVVNEAVSDDSEQLFRRSPWYKICGEEFITKAFEFAHKADPEALLFYNDYNTEQPAKRDHIYDLIKKLKENGVPIHGVGLQGHWSLTDPTQRDLQDALAKYSTLGIELQITELDVSVYPKEKGRREKRPDESDVFTGDVEKSQAEQYKRIFDLLRSYKAEITGVTFWNVSDKHSWLDNFPVRGRKNYPLLFDQELSPKVAYWEIVKF